MIPIENLELFFLGKNKGPIFALIGESYGVKFLKIKFRSVHISPVTWADFIVNRKTLVEVKCVPERRHKAGYRSRYRFRFEQYENLIATDSCVLFIQVGTNGSIYCKLKSIREIEIKTTTDGIEAYPNNIFLTKWQDRKKIINETPFCSILDSL